MTNYQSEATAAVEKNESLKDGACLMAVQVTGSCGEATLSKAAMLLDGQTVNSELVKGTTLQWFPKDKLRFVNAAAQKVNRLFSSSGVAFGKGLTMVPLTLADEVQTELDLIKSEFNSNVQELVSNFDQSIEEHKLANPDTADLIERYKLEASQFEGRFIFKPVPPMAVQPLYEDQEEELRENMTQTLWTEVAESADKLAKGSFIAKEKCSQRAVSAFRKIKNKLINLAFLDDGVLAVVASFDAALADLPKAGPVEDGQFHRLSNYIQTVSNEENLRAIASGELNANEDVEEEEDLSLELESDVSLLTDAFNVETEETTPVDVVTPVTTNSPLPPATESINVFDDELDFGGF